MQPVNAPNATSSYPAHQNRVIQPRYRASQNYYSSDLLLRHWLERNLTAQARAEMEAAWQQTGTRAAGPLTALSMTADKQGPQLMKRDFWGNTVDEIRFHPAYGQMTQMAVESRMFEIKWKPELRQRYAGQLNGLGFASVYLFGLGESGLVCPLCMTDGAAVLVDRFCTPEDQARLLPGIWTLNGAELKTGAMFLTEKAGGSDVGANIVTAVHEQGEWYRLYGEKWFCSNANGDIIFVLARTNPDVKGTRGLSIFLLEPTLPDGSKNTWEVVRLKDKLGVRSMASAEILLNGALAKRVGPEYDGFLIMTHMINISRVYNSMMATTLSRRGLVEAWQFILGRNSFGKEAAGHPLIRTKVLELAALQTASHYLSWRAVQALGRAEQGNEDEAQLLRLLTPMTKKWTAEKGVYIIREAMELMGGLGYIEDGIVPRVFRDALVLPIWEGAGNIMVLDMLRASAKSSGLRLVFGEIAQAAALHGDRGQLLANELARLQQTAQRLMAADEETMQAAASPFFEQLTHLYQLALLLQAEDATSSAWTAPAFSALARYAGFVQADLLTPPPSVETVAAAMAWCI